MRFTNISTLTTLLLFVALSMSAPVSAQINQLIEFEDDSHDFGEIKEIDGNGEHKFMFKNTSDQPVKLTYVKASCGCTATDYSKEVIKPGESGYVNAVYRTKRRPGKFSKAVTVRAATVDNINEEGKAKDLGKAQTKVLRFNGNVIPKPLGPEDKYPFEMGCLRLSTNHISMGRVAHESEGVSTMTIYNSCDKPVSIKGMEFDGKHVTYEIDGPETLEKQGDTTVVKVTYDAKQVDDFGFIHSSGNLMTDDAEMPEKRLYVSANIFEDFSALSPEELENAPILEVSETMKDFGQVEQDAKLTHTFTLTNNGKRPLKIRKLKTNCPCVTTEMDGMEIAPGKSKELEVTFDTKGRRSYTAQNVTVISNDPKNSSTRLILKAQVQQ